MTEQEKLCLEQAFFGNNGWYKKINDSGMIRLKLAAMSLGVTNNVFTVDKNKEEEILEQIELFSEELQVLMIRGYVKQKLVTYKTLKNYLQKVKKTDKMSITLFRGINRPYQGEKYMFIGLESWTTNSRMAYKFARDEGYVLEREYPIDQIFVTKKSAFKNKSAHRYRNNGFFVNRESEVIVENLEQYWDFGGGQIRLALDNDIY